MLSISLAYLLDIRIRESVQSIWLSPFTRLQRKISELYEVRWPKDKKNWWSPFLKKSLREYEGHKKSQKSLKNEVFGVLTKIQFIHMDFFIWIWTY